MSDYEDLWLKPLLDIVKREVRNAVRIERERCAKVVEAAIGDEETP